MDSRLAPEFDINNATHVCEGRAWLVDDSPCVSIDMNQHKQWDGVGHFDSNDACSQQQKLPIFHSLKLQGLTLKQGKSIFQVMGDL